MPAKQPHRSKPRKGARKRAPKDSPYAADEVHLPDAEVAQLVAEALQPAPATQWTRQAGDDALLTSRPAGHAWTTEELYRDRERCRAVLALLASWGRNVETILMDLQALRERYNARMRAHGLVWWPAALSGTVTGEWRMHPDAHTVPRPTQRRRTLEEWKMDERARELAGKSTPAARVERETRVCAELDGLEAVWGAYDRPHGAAGRPGVGCEVVAIRQMFQPRQSNHPLWEYVAILARCLFPDVLPPTFSGAHAKQRAMKQRQRH